MNITKTQDGDKTILALEGRLDTTTAPQLQDTLIPAFSEAKQIELDFGKLVYVSSAGLRVLLMGEKAARAGGVTLTLTNVSEEVLEVFKMTGFADILNIV